MKILVLSAKQDESDSLAKALAEYGHRVTVAGANLGGRQGLGKLREAIRIALKEARHTEVIILDGARYDRAVALMAHKVSDVPLVLYLKGHFPTEFEENINTSLGKAINWFFMSRLMKSCVHVIYVSRWLQEKYLNTPKIAIVKDKPSSVIHLGPDAFFHPANIQPDLQPDAEISLCYAGDFGYFDKARGIVLLLDAYSRLLKTFPHLRLYICGDGKHRHLLQERASQLNLNAKVVFTGRVSREELREYYRLADIFVYPSFLDGCPKTLLDAQACGAAAIVTGSSGAAELVMDGVSGIVCQPTVQSLVDAIVYLVQNPHIRQSMAIQAVEHMQHNLSWEVSAGKFNELLANWGYLGNENE
jgi:glycosyltransferase involved in cell wall biosynthesis